MKQDGQIWDVLVVGGGAAGLMAAGFAARQGAGVLVLERNARMARKLMITGKGRCNLTNDCDRDTLIAHTVTNPRFLYSAFSFFSPRDVMALLEELGVPLKVERGNRVFPVSDRAVDIVDALVGFARRQGARFRQGRVADIVPQEDAVYRVSTQEGEVISARSVIVATGGLSYPATGSTGDGYAIARALGHTVVQPAPSLVPVEVEEGFCSRLQGLSLKNVTLTVRDGLRHKTVFSQLGELMFTHYGLSGPLMLSASALMRPMEPGRYTMTIDCKPGLTMEQLDARLVRDLAQNANRDFANSLSALLPRSLIPVMVALSGIEGSLKCNQVTRPMRQKFCALCKGLSLTAARFRPVEEAVVTAGGVSVQQVDPKTMQSKLRPGLYFAGEVLDVDAYTGGFNLQIAFSTGALAGQSAAQSMLSSRPDGETACKG